MIISGMIALLQPLGTIRRVIVAFTRSFALLWSWPELSCRDCVYHLTCSLQPGNDCISRAGWIASRGNRPVQHRSLIDWWSGLGP
jgi:hypothetical protein